MKRRDFFGFAGGAIRFLLCLKPLKLWAGTNIPRAILTEEEAFKIIERESKKFPIYPLNEIAHLKFKEGDL